MRLARQLVRCLRARSSVLQRRRFHLPLPLSRFAGLFFPATGFTPPDASHRLR